MKKLVALLVALNLLALVTWAIRPVFSTGSLGIPNTIAAQPAGNLQASLLDQNWTTIRDYVNNREVTLGGLAARPAAGTAGRWYSATDVNGGTLYVDTGSGWTQVSGGVNANAGAYRVIGLQGATATTNNNTSYSVTADYVVLRSPADGSTVVRTATTTLTNDVTLAGSAANGRDQSGTFTAQTWIHLYYIWNGSTLATVSSNCGPTDVTGACPTVGGPNLPTGYTHWAYIGPLRFATSSLLNATRINCGRAYYYAAQPLLVNGTASSETLINNIPVVVPPNATNINLRATLDGNTAINGITLTLRHVTAKDFIVLTGRGANSSNQADTVTLDFPNNGRTIYYLMSSANANADMDVLGYGIPNGCG